MQTAAPDIYGNKWILFGNDFKHAAVHFRAGEYGQADIHEKVA